MVVPILTALTFLGLTISSVLLSSVVYLVAFPFAIGGVPYSAVINMGLLVAAVEIIVAIAIIVYYTKKKR